MNYKIKSKPATNAEGHLIWTSDGYYFRVYREDFSFKDYKLLHSDLLIRISDHDAEFYESESGEMFLDHSKSTLGIK